MVINCKAFNYYSEKDSEPDNQWMRREEGNAVMGFTILLPFVSHTLHSNHPHVLENSTDAGGEAGTKLRQDRLSSSNAVSI